MMEFIGRITQRLLGKNLGTNQVEASMNSDRNTRRNYLEKFKGIGWMVLGIVLGTIWFFYLKITGISVWEWIGLGVISGSLLATGFVEKRTKG